MLEDDVKQALKAAGQQLKADLWHPNDEAFLAARAKDLVGLQKKAHESTTDAKRKAYLAAAKDVLNHVKLLAVIRMETAAAHVTDALGRFFLDKVVPALVKLLPALIGLL
jgi:hypothetical protein